MAKKSSYRNKHLKKMLLATGIAGILGAGSLFFSHGSEEMTINKPQTSVKANRHNIDDDKVLCAVIYRTDTLSKPSAALLYYCAGEVTRNYVEKDNRYMVSLGLFAHEWWHYHNGRLGYRAGKTYTPTYYGNLCMHDEISACINDLLVKRYEYLGAKDKKSVIEKYENGICGFYFKALKGRKINPTDDSPQARKKEWSFIANGMRDFWIKEIAPAYSQGIYNMTLRYYNNNTGEMFRDSTKSEKDYLDMCHKMYNIGGVDFFKYMDEDIFHSDERIMLMEKIHQVKSLRADERFLAEYVGKNLPAISNFSVDKKQKALQHLIVSGILLKKLKDINAQKLLENSKLVEQCYNNILRKLQTDESYAHFVGWYTKQSASEVKFVSQDNEFQDNEYDSFVQGLYARKDIDLTKCINNFTSEKVPCSEITYTDDAKFASNDVLFFNKMLLDWAREDSKKYVKMDIDNVEKPKPENNEKRRISGELSIMIPNFSEPILLYANEEQIDKIYSYIEYFNSIPDVYKRCDAEELQKYVKLHPEDKVKFVDIKWINYNTKDK